MSLSLPPRYRGQASASDCVIEAVLRKTAELVEECVKDKNGGMLPRRKYMASKLKCELHPDGRVFYWKNEPILFLAPHRFQKTPAGEVQLVLPHKKLYIKEPEDPQPTGTVEKN